MKLHEQVLDSYIREMVNINDMQLGFVPGEGSTGSIFVVRQLQEKYIGSSESDTISSDSSDSENWDTQSRSQSLIRPNFLG